jgi:hypothetical protein
MHVGDSKPSVLGLVVLPTIVTLCVNAARAYAEFHGDVTRQTGGGGALLGIVWLPLLFGAWFAFRLGGAGSLPRLRPGWPWVLVSLLLLVGTVASQIVGIDRADKSDAAFASLRVSVLTIVGVALPIAAFQFVIWRRLALTLLVYALVARGMVLFLTWLAKSNGWDTHYTKFGPAGLETDMAGTMVSASIAQLGFWVPFTMLTGMLTGTALQAFASRRSGGHSASSQAS